MRQCRACVQAVKHMRWSAQLAALRLGRLGLRASMAAPINDAAGTMLWGQKDRRLTCCLLGVWMFVPVRPLADTPHARLRIRPVHTTKCLHDLPLARMLHRCRHYCAAVVVDFWLLRLRLRLWCQLWRLCSAERCEVPCCGEMSPESPLYYVNQLRWSVVTCCVCEPRLLLTKTVTSLGPS